VGSELWVTLVPFEEDFDAALQKARAKVFQDGAYGYSGRKKPQTIKEAIERGGEEGTHSVLDMTAVTKRQTAGTVTPLSKQTLLKLFQTERPTEADWWKKYFAVRDRIERGRGILVVLYENEVPAKIVFAGLAWD